MSLTEAADGAAVVYVTQMSHTLLGLLLAPLLLSAQESTQSRLRADLTFLASPALEGRLSLQRGSEVAIHWIASEFAKAGLEPAGGGSFLQEMTLVEYRRDNRETLLVVESGGKKRRYEPNKGFSGAFPRDVTVRAPAVFAGYGITAPEFGYDDYAGLDARGKIVIVFDHEPQEGDPASVFNGVGNTRHASSRLKALNAQRHGAEAVLVASEPNRKHPSNEERRARIPTRPERERRLLPQALADSEIRIPLFTLDDEPARELLAATGRRASELQRRIDETLQPSSQPLAETIVELRYVNAEARRAGTANVIGLLEGSDPALKAETIVYSAHYDHDGTGDGNLYAGADDNGSGTVAVVELARVFARSAARPRRSILFAVFAAEERGLLGSYHYIANPMRPLASTRAVINFDMIGRNETPSRQTDGLMRIDADTSEELNLIGTIHSADYRRIVERENRQVGLRLNYKWDEDAALNIYQRSDQFPFSLHAIPAVWWFTGFHPDYHQVTDTVEKINFAKMEKIVRLAYLAGLAMANDGEVPRFESNPRRVR